jgi:hypothetical protein
VLIRNGDNSLFSPRPLSCQSIVSQLLKSDGMRRPVSDEMLYAPKLSTRLKRKR